MFRLVATSDTHHTVDISTIPDGDAFLHCGDLCTTGYPADFESQLEWLSALPHETRLFVCGNHDFHLQVYPGPALQQLRKAGVTVIGLPGNDNYASFTLPNGMTVLGVPYVTNLPRWAFNGSEDQIWRYLTKMKYHDIIVSHAPPRGVMDEPVPGKHVGIEAFRAYAKTYKPKKWLFGHIHECYGVDRQFETDFYNVAMCNRDYVHANPPMVVDL